VTDGDVSEHREEHQDPRPAESSPPVRRPRWSLVALAAIVVLLVVLTIWRIGHPGVTSSTNAGTLALVAPHPDEVLYALPIFVWHAVPEAATYNLQVVDGNGGVVFATTTADTTVSVPQSLVLDSAVHFRWWVRAHTRAGVTVTSALIPFRMSSP